MSIDRAKALKAAQKHLAKGQLDRAIAEFEKVVESDPSDARSQLKLGDLYVKKGDSKNAARTYRRVADQYSQQGFFLKAVAVFKQILKLDPQDLDTHEQLGEMYKMLSLTSDAVATFEHVVDGYTRAGESQKAMSALGHLADLDPDNVAARIRHAEALSKADRIDEAIEAFERGADALKQQGRMDDFVKVTERLLYHSHDVPRARELATLYLERSDPKHALAHLQVCFKADPKDVATLELLARAFQQLGQTQKAVSVYKELAQVHAGRQQHAEQAFVLQAILELAPDDAEARSALDSLDVDEETVSSEIEVLEDDYDDLIVVEDEEVLEVAAEAPAASQPAPEDVAAPAAPETDARQAQIDRLLSECDVFIRYGLRDKVLAQLDRVLDIDPMNVEARHRLKAFHVKEGNVEDAVTQLLMLADAVGASDPGRARAFLEEAGQLAPDNAIVASLLEQQAGRAAVAAPAVEDEDDLVILDEEVEEDRASEAMLAQPADAGPLRSLAPTLEPGASLRPEVQEPGLVFETGDEDDEPELVLEAGYEDDEPELVLEAGDEDEPELVLEAGGEDGPEEIVLEAEAESERPPAMVSAAPAPAVQPPPVASFAPPVPAPTPSAAPAPPPPPAAHPVPSAAPAAPAPVAPRAPSPAPAAPAPAAFSVEDLPEEIAEVLEEADFYIAQGLTDEARDSLQDALEDNPDHPALLAKLAELDGGAAPEEAPPEDQSFALAQKLAGEASPGGQGTTPLGMDEVLHQFKEGVKNQVDSGDTDTHYDLGIAYMEMGLHAEAIDEFKLCLQDPARACTANTMIGLSYVSKGEMDSGITHFKLALATESASEDEQLDLWFEIGNAYELLGDNNQALVWYEQVEEKNPEFRDVAERIQRIGKPKSADEEADEFDTMFDNMILKE